MTTDKQSTALQQLILKLEQYNGDDPLGYAVMQATELLESLPTTQPQLKEDGGDMWREVPVGERLPVRDEKYTAENVSIPVICITSDGSQYQSFCDLDSKEWISNDGEDEDIANVESWLEKVQLPIQG